MWALSKVYVTRVIYNHTTTILCSPLRGLGFMFCVHYALKLGLHCFCLHLSHQGDSRNHCIRMPNSTTLDSKCALQKLNRASLGKLGNQFKCSSNSSFFCWILMLILCSSSTLFAVQFVFLFSRSVCSIPQIAFFQYFPMYQL